MKMSILDCGQIILFFFFFRLRLELYIPTGEHSFLDPEVLVSFKAIGLPKALFHQFGSR